MSTASYNVHGLSVSVSAGPEILDAVHKRLRRFSLQDRSSEDRLVFKYRAVSWKACRKEESVAGRLVYEFPRGEIRYSDVDDVLLITTTTARAECEIRTGKVVVTYSESEAPDIWLMSHPLLTIPLMEVLKRRGLYSLHCAGLSLDGRGVLFPGTSGAGKSTVALTLVRSGFAFLGDDTIFLKPNAAGVQVLAFPDEIDVTELTLGFFPEVVGRKSSLKGWPKHQVDVCTYGDAIEWECSPSTLVFPEICLSSASSLEALDERSAFLRLVPNVLLTDGPSSQSHLDTVAQLVRECTCYRLAFGSDFESLPELIRPLLQPRELAGNQQVATWMRRQSHSGS